MKFLFTCGGTAGHINPAVAVAGRIKELLPESEFLFIGAEGKMETRLVPHEGYEIRTVHISSISRRMNLEGLKHNLNTAKNLIISRKEATKIIEEFQPDVVIGTGGYVCYPVLMAAHRRHIPTAVHESNAMPGLTTKMLANKVDRIMVGFEESRQHYSHPERVTVTGTPVRGSFNLWTKESARKALGIGENEVLVLSVWGSLGAGYMNETFVKMVPQLKNSTFRMIHVTGTQYHERVSKALEAVEYDRERINVMDYLYDMPCAAAAADLIMCRAGASTLAEMTYMGKPCIIVPSPNVTNHHQEKNARVLERAGGAKVLLEGEFTEETLLREIEALTASSETLERMSQAMRSLAVSDATEQITEIVLGLTKE